MSKEQMGAIAQMLSSAAAASDPDATVEEMRENMEAMIANFPPPDGSRTIDETVGGVPCQWQFIDGTGEGPVLLYFHGGGYVLGSPKTHRNMVSALSHACGIRALAPDYRLAPEYPFPAAIEDAVAVYKALLDGGVDAERIAVAGDSAGGGLALALLLSAKERGLPQPACAALLSPWSDLRIVSESYETRKDADPMITRDGIKKMAALYLGGAEADTPIASPLLADLSGLAPLLIHVGDAEVLLDDAVVLAENVQSAGTEATLKIWDDMIHVFQAFYSMVDEGRQSIGEIGAFVQQYLEKAEVAA